MTVQYKTQDVKNEYLKTVKQKIDDLEFKIETLKMKLAIVPESVQKYYLEQIDLLNQKKQKLNETIKRLEGEEENVLGNIRNGIETSWNDLKEKMDNVLEKFRKEVPDKDEFINRTEGYLAEINLNMAEHEKGFKEKIGGVTEGLGQEYDKQVEKLIKRRDLILGKIKELRNAENKAEHDIRNSIAKALEELKEGWEGAKSRF